MGGLFRHVGTPGRWIPVSLAFGCTTWPFMARHVRGQTLQIKAQQCIEAARTVSSSDTRIIMQHIVPNLCNIVLTVATLDMVGVVIGEATLSLAGGPGRLNDSAASALERFALAGQELNYGGSVA